MATPAYGLDADLAAKQAAAHDPALEKEVCDWIAKVTGISQTGTMAEWLHDGQVLCAVANAVKPGSVKKVNTGAMVFKQRENITYFQKFCRDCGVPEIAMFGTDDLFDAKNMNSVTKTINMLGGCIQTHVPEYSGPKLGIAVEVDVKDVKRAQGVANQSAGLTQAMEVQKLTQGQRQVAGGTCDGVKAPSAGGADAAGLDRDLAAKKDAKFDPQLAKQACEWIEKITGEKQGDASMQEWLKNGQVLCRLANKIKPGTVANINTMATPFKERENITFFQTAMRQWGVPESSMFGTDDLYEASNLGQFVAGVFALGGALQSNPSFSALPKLGAQVSHHLADEKRNVVATSQYEAMEKAMEVEKPKNTGITSGAEAGAR